MDLNMVCLTFKCNSCGKTNLTKPCTVMIDINEQGGVVAFYPIARCLISTAMDARVSWELVEQRS
jgi:hypothetical protein